MMTLRVVDTPVWDLVESSCQGASSARRSQTTARFQCNEDRISLPPSKSRNPTLFIRQRPLIQLWSPATLVGFIFDILLLYVGSSLLSLTFSPTRMTDGASSPVPSLPDLGIYPPVHTSTPNFATYGTSTTSIAWTSTSVQA